MRPFIVISIFFCLIACSHSPNQPALPEHNCQGIENWVLKAQRQEVPAHTIRLIAPYYDNDSLDTFYFYWPIVHQKEYQFLTTEEYSAIAQPTHYWLPQEIVTRAAACFEAPVIKTPSSTKSLATIGKSSLLIEGSNHEISMTYIPHLSSKLDNPQNSIDEK